MLNARQTMCWIQNFQVPRLKNAHELSKQHQLYGLKNWMSNFFCILLSILWDYWTTKWNFVHNASMLYEKIILLIRDK